MSNSIVEKLSDERNNLWEQMKELNDREINEERSLDASEKEQWDKMNDRMSEIDARTQELASVEEANKKSEEARAIFETSSAPVIEKTEEASPSDADILRSMATGEVRSHNFEKRDLTVGRKKEIEKKLDTKTFQVKANRLVKRTIKDIRKKEIARKRK